MLGSSHRLCLTALLLVFNPVSQRSGSRAHAAEQELPLARVPGGEYRPLMQADAVSSVAVHAFWLMTRPVRNDEFLAFVMNHPSYRRDRIARAFADTQYLAQFETATRLGSAKKHGPVTRVSWFAARAFCSAHGLRLPSESEWEWAAAASNTRADARRDPEFRQQILDWYARPMHEPPDVPYGRKNLYGIYDLHGVIWEWVEDFNADFAIEDRRSQGEPSTSTLTCGAGALRASDAEDYPAFLRLGFRSSLQATYTAASLGFRCARDERTPAPGRS